MTRLFKSTITDHRQKQLESDKLLAIKLYNEITDVHAILSPFVGKKVLTVQGYWTKAFETAITPIREHRRGQTQKSEQFIYNCQHLAITNSYKSLYLEHKAWFIYEQFAENEHRSDNGAYNNINLYIAKVDEENKLIELRELEELQEALEVYIARDWKKFLPIVEEAERLENEAKELRKDLPYFFNH